MDNKTLQESLQYISRAIASRDLKDCRVLLIDNGNFDIFDLLQNAASIDKLIIDKEVNNESYVKMPYRDDDFDVCISLMSSDFLEENKLVTLYAELLRVSKVTGISIILEKSNFIEVNSIKMFEEVNNIDETDSFVGFTLIKSAQHPTTFNCVLTRRLLADYIEYYSSDQVFVDLLLLDFWARKNGLPIVSSGRHDDESYILERSYRVWEYRQIIKGLNLDGNNSGKLLDIGGASCHITYYAALNGYDVTSLDINPEIIAKQQKTSEFMNINNLETIIMDMRNLSAFEDNSFDMAMSASVFEHLTAEDQIRSIKEIARVVKPGGKIAISFDYGIPAPGLNPDLPPPHDPPSTSMEVIRRYCEETDLVFESNTFSSFIYPFWESVYYAPAFILLTKKGELLDINKNTSVNWQSKNSIMFSKFADNELLAEFIGYLINNIETKSTLRRETLYTHIQKINELEFDREQRLKIVEILEKESTERLIVINKQQEIIVDLEQNRDKQQEIMVDLEQNRDKQQAMIANLAKDRDDKFDIIKKQEAAISELEKVLLSYKSDKLISLLAKWRIKDGKQ